MRIYSLGYFLIFAVFLIAPNQISTQPTTVPGKIGAGLVRIINRHPYILTFPVAPLSFVLFKPPHSSDNDNFFPFAMTLIAWYVTGRLLKTTTKVIMDSCEIEPLQD